MYYVMYYTLQYISITAFATFNISLVARMSSVKQDMKFKGINRKFKNPDTHFNNIK